MHHSSKKFVCGILHLASLEPPEASNFGGRQPRQYSWRIRILFALGVVSTHPP